MPEHENTIKLMPPNQHWYESPTVPGLYYPSVTTVTAYLPKGEFFERYLAEQESYEESKRILQEAAERGTRVHEASEKLDRGEVIKYGQTILTDEEYKLMTYYISWHQEYLPEIKQVELRLVSDKHKLGGTLDRIYMIDGKRTLLDLKSSKSAIFDAHWLQVAAYADMYEYLHKEKIEQVAILRLTGRRKDGYEYVIKSRPEWQKDLKQFKRTYDTMIYLQKGKKIEPKIEEVPAELKL